MAGTQFGFAGGPNGMPTPQASYIGRAYTLAVTPVAVAGNTLAEQSFTLTGLQTADLVVVNKPTAQSALQIAGARVSAADTLTIQYANFSVNSQTPTAETYKVLAFKCG